jgi:hypothetical protein
MGSSRVFAWIPVSSRLLTLRKQIVDIPSVATDGAVIACALVSLALWIGLDYRRAGAGARFEPTALAIVALYACAVLGVAFALARSLRPRTHFRCVLFTVVALLPVVIAAGFIIEVHWDRTAARVACGLVVLYGLAYLANAMRLLTGAFQPRAALVLVVALAALLPLARIADLSPWLWTPASTVPLPYTSSDSPVWPSSTSLPRRSSSPHALWTSASELPATSCC